MRFYVYKCDNDHVFRKRRATEDRDAGLFCPTCKAHAHRDITASVDDEERPKNTKPLPLRLMDFACDGCGNEHERMLDVENGDTNDNQKCGICEHPLRPVFSAKISRESEMYAARENFDPGAGRTFRNARERRQWMAEQGVVEMGTEAEKSVRATHERERAADEACRRNLEADMDYYRNSPDPAMREAFANLSKTIATREVEMGGRRQSAVPLAS